MINQTLIERKNKYGSFYDNATLTQALTETMRLTNKWDKLEADQKEALEMIAHKISRILNGDPNYADSWHDIAGYAMLVENRLNEDE